MCSAKKKEDRRRARRIDCKNVLVNYRKVGLLRRVMNRAPSIDDKSNRQPCLDISRTGVSFLTREKLKEGQELLMRISFGPRRPSVEVNGQIEWRDEGKGKYDYSVGACFVDVSPSAWNTLLHLSKFVTPSDRSDAWKLGGADGVRKSKSWSERSKPNVRDRMLRERFKSLTSDVAVEELEKLLDERKGRPCEDFEPGDSTDKHVRKELRSLRERLDDVDIEEDPLKAYLELQEVSDRFSCLEEVKLSDEQDRQRDMIHRKLDNKLDGVEDQWNRRTRRLAGKIANLGRRVDRMLDNMIVKIQESEIEKEGAVWAGITEHAEALSEMIRRIETMVERVPQGSCESLPFWDLLREAHKNLLKPHARNVFLFKCAAAMAHADGDMKAHERDFLGGVADDIHLSAEEEKELMSQARDLGTGEFQGSPERAREVIHSLYLCCLSDNEMTAEEVEMLKRIGSSWGVTEKEVEAILKQRRQLDRLCQKGVRLMRKLVQMIEDGRIQDKASVAKKFNEGVAKLASAIRKIEEKVSATPEMRLDDLPDWDVLRSARKDIMRPHAQNMFLLKASIRMAVADGEATKPEEDFLNVIVDRMRYPRSMAAELLANPHEVQIPEFYGSRKQARAMVQKLYRCALADGTVDEKEKEFLEKIATQLGVSRPEIVDEMTKVEDEEEVTFLDRIAVRRQIEEKKELGEGIKVGGDIDDQIRGYVFDNFQVPEGDDLLVTYENYLMGDILECGALTPHAVLLRTPDHKKEAVKISNIKGVEANAVATYLLLKDGRNVQMSRMAEPFIHLVVESVQESQRHL